MIKGLLEQQLRGAPGVRTRDLIQGHHSGKRHCRLPIDRGTVFCDLEPKRMAALSVNEYLDLVRLSGLVDHDRLESAIARLPSPAGDSEAAWAGLVSAGILTAWQDRNLREGRHKGFFLGKYKLLDHLGSGGMGSVYLAEHAVMHHRVAIKVLPRQRIHQSSYLERFIQEARAAARLDHPNVVRAFDVDQEGDNHYIVMDYVDGVDLEAIVRRDGPLAYQRVADYTRQAACGLAHAHQAGLIHRDIKPGNLLVDRKENVRILDLGLARFTDEEVPSLTMEYDEKIIGTVNYLSPEQALNSHQVDTRADIYSLGCTMYFMLTAGPPFPDGTLLQRAMQHQTAHPAHPRSVRPDVPEGLVAICEKMMEKSPDRRYQRAEDVAQVLADWCAAREAGAASRSLAHAAPNLASVSSYREELTLAPLEPSRESTTSSSVMRQANTGSGTGSTLVGSNGNTRPPASKGNPSSGTGAQRQQPPAGSAAGKSSVLSGMPAPGSAVSRAGLSAKKLANTSSRSSIAAAPRAASTDAVPLDASSSDQSNAKADQRVGGKRTPKKPSPAKSAALSSLMDEWMDDGPASSISGGMASDSRQSLILGTAATGTVLARPKYQAPTHRTNYAQVATYSLIFLIFAGAVMAGLVLLVGYSATETLKEAPAPATKQQRSTDD